ncbi:MAG: acyl-CoA thioesterase [Pseudomonadota bacterium]
MNMILRFIYLLLVVSFRKKVKILDKVQTPFRVCITDLDLLMHMNNGKYFSIMDLARVDLMLRSGSAQILQTNGIYPVVVAETMHFRKSLKLFNTFNVETQLLGWDEKDFYVEQQFLRNDEIYARALVKARMLKRSGEKITPADCLTLVGSSRTSPPLPDYLKTWLTTTEL